MDWNWFYSSLAQSTAALVAFFGGFVATKIISNQADHARLLREIQQCILTCHRISEKASGAKFIYLIRQAHKTALRQVQSLIDKDKGAHQAEYYYMQSQFSEYESHVDIISIINELIRQKKKYPDKALLGPAAMWRDDSGVMLKVQHDTTLQEARDEIRDLIVDVNHASRLASSLAAEANANPFSSKLLQFSAATVLILFFLGVIYPMSFLPTDGNTSFSFFAFFHMFLTFKGFLLASVSTVFSVVLFILLLANLRLKVDDAYINELHQFSDSHNFAKEFQIARDVKKFRIQMEKDQVNNNAINT